MGASGHKVRTTTEDSANEEASLLTKLSVLLQRREEVVFAYLFGSRALGYSRPDSDIDLAVFFGNGAAKWARLELEEELSQGLRLPVQVVALNEELKPRFLQSVLSTGVVIKDSPSRIDWEKKFREARREREMKGMEEDYRERLSWIEEKVGLILRALPLLDRIDLEEVKQENLEAIQAFLGAFFMLFEPLETIARRMTSYTRLYLNREEEPVTLRGQMEMTMEILNLDEETRERFNGIIELRNQLAHAYWEVAEISFPLDMKEMKGAFEKFADALRAFIASERERLG